MDDVDRQFILEGVAHGFDIIEPESVVVPVEMENHKSVSKGSEWYKLAQDQICTEIELGNYVVVNHKPLVVSALGAVPKDSGSIRLIHDCSLPRGRCVNDYAPLENKLKFQSVDDAVSLLCPGYWLAKLDLKAAYRSVSISKASQRVTGLKWQFGLDTVYMYDNKLPFGSRWAPGIFHRLSQAIRRIMVGKGHTGVVAYLDDFLCVGSSFEECKTMLLDLIGLVRKLGFWVSYNKVIGPVQRLVFLGIELDTIGMSLALPQDKLLKCRDSLKKFSSRVRASKKQVQQLLGLLNWAAGVVRTGRVYLRGLISLCKGTKHSNSRVVLNALVLEDIDWWYKCIQMFNGRSIWLSKLPITCVFTDACNSGAGGIFCNDWFYLNWQVDWPRFEHLHINYKEILAIVLAAWRWAPFWCGRRIFINTDNMVAVAAINKAKCQSLEVLQAVKFLSWLSVLFNFELTAYHIAGAKNVYADQASRLADPSVCNTFLVDNNVSLDDICNHMSYRSMHYIFRNGARCPTGIG